MTRVLANTIVVIYCLCNLLATTTAFTIHTSTSIPRIVQIKTTSSTHLQSQKDSNPPNSNNDSNNTPPNTPSESNPPKNSSHETPLDKALRKARARSEIERLTSGPNAVFDRDGELSKLIGGISTGIPPDSPEAETERHYQTLESSMSKAVREGDFAAAAQTRDAIDSLHIDDCGFVLQANSAFYTAFSEKDYEGMRRLWLSCETVQCVHPSHKPLVGYQNVVESWKSLFDSDVKAFQTNTMEPSNIKLSVKGCTAWLTCDEEVYSPKFVRGVGKTKELVKKMMATNIFRKVDEKWYMVHHHATWHSDYDNGEVKINGAKTQKKGNMDPLQSTTISLGGVGGLNGLIGGGGGGSGDGVVKRVVMGNLNDLLNGGLSDILSGSEKGGSSDGKTIIQVSGDFDDDNDDDDDDDVVEHFKRELAEPLKKNLAVPKDALRQNCISALRKLCTQGSISHNQKRLLLTDIISCSAKGEFSMVEVAYELLCGEGDDKDAAEEDFADQCRVFSSSLDTSSQS